MTSVSQVRSLSLSSLKRLFRNAMRGRVDICCLYRAYKQIQAHYSCMRPKCTKFSHGTGGHVGDTRAPARRCVLCLFLAEMCHMSLVPPFLVKSNGDTEVSPERQRFVNNSRASLFEIPFGTHPAISETLIQFVHSALDLLCQLLMVFHFEMTIKKNYPF